MTSTRALASFRKPAVERSPGKDGTLSFYDENAATYAQFAGSFSMEPELKRFRSLLRTGASVLDVGCGSGRDLAALRACGLRPIGLDFSSRLAAMATEHSGCAVIVGDMRNPPFADATFNGIWAVAALLHLEQNELLQTLRQFRRILLADGVLFASMKMGMGSERTADGRLYTYVMPEDWTNLLIAAGFTGVQLQIEVAGGRGKSSTAWIQSLARAG